VTTLTKRMAEDLTEFLQARGVAARYLHSDIDTLERMAILQSLREGEFHVLVGINLLREGLDLPEVSLVAILDADKEGFLRSARSLIQTFGRAARNDHGTVILYADQITEAMRQAMDETNRRRAIQQRANEERGITPRTVRRPMEDALAGLRRESRRGSQGGRVAEEGEVYGGDVQALLQDLRRRMRKAAELLEFEEAARLRDRIRTLEARL